MCVSYIEIVTIDIAMVLSEIVLSSVLAPSSGSTLLI
jgi:hypothetical protein